MMMNTELANRVQSEHGRRFGVSPSVLSYAPGRIEVLGNHTDYNEGFVLSAAIDLGIAVALSSRPEKKCSLFAADIGETASVLLPVAGPLVEPEWANYVAGVLAELRRFGLDEYPHGFDITIAGDIPIASGLSSSAALEIAASLAFSAAAGLTLPLLETAKLCQSAEHRYIGTRCGLLDQISSLFGKAGAMVFCDFRSLEIKTHDLDDTLCFLVADTGVKHNLVDSEYNERRARCEQACRFFAKAMHKPVPALRDVSPEDWQRFSRGMHPVTARRAAHIIGENERVRAGVQKAITGDVQGFGRILYESHESSRINFENSCRELDFIVSAARDIEGVYGARLSGGGFGGSAIMLADRSSAPSAAKAIEARYAAAFGRPCANRIIKPSDGAFVRYSGKFN